MRKVKPKNTPSPCAELLIRKPLSTEGLAVHRLVASSPPLDTNSVYCNLLQCTHFQETCRIALAGETVAAFVSGYRKPDDPKTLFIWQVVTAEAFRGQGLGTTLIESILDEEPGFTALETTITPDNRASWRLFESLSTRRKGSLSSSPFFICETHFGGEHDTENLVRICFS